MNFILLEKENCIGCAACYSLDSKNWEMEENGKSHLKNSKLENNNEIREINEINKYKETAECCPINAIHIFENNKKII